MFKILNALKKQIVLCQRKYDSGLIQARQRMGLKLNRFLTNFIKIKLHNRNLNIVRKLKT